MIFHKFPTGLKTNEKNLAESTARLPNASNNDTEAVEIAIVRSLVLKISIDGIGLPISVLFFQETGRGHTKEK